MLGLGSSITTKSAVYTTGGSTYTNFRTWDNDSDLIGSNGFQLFGWSGTNTLSFEEDALDGEGNYAKLAVGSTQSDSCQWRDNSVKDDSGASIYFSSYTRYRVEAKMYASLDSSRTQITFSTAFGTTSQDRFQTTLQDETWTSIDVSNTLSGDVSATHFYLWDFDQSGNFPIAGEFFAMKDVKLSLG